LEDDITGRNLMPKYLVRLQFKADSVRAADWARQSNDSSRWLKYQTPSFRSMMLDTSGDSRSPLYLNLKKAPAYKSALAERMAKIRAAAAAAAAAAPVNPATQLPDSGRKAPDSARKTPDSGRKAPAPVKRPDSNGQRKAPTSCDPPRKDSFSVKKDSSQ